MDLHDKYMYMYIYIFSFLYVNRDFVKGSKLTNKISHAL